MHKAVINLLITALFVFVSIGAQAIPIRYELTTDIPEPFTSTPKFLTGFMEFDSSDVQPGALLTVGNLLDFRFDFQFEGQWSKANGDLVYFGAPFELDALLNVVDFRVCVSAFDSSGPCRDGRPIFNVGPTYALASRPGFPTEIIEGTFAAWSGPTPDPRQIPTPHIFTLLGIAACGLLHRSKPRRLPTGGTRRA